MKGLVKVDMDSKLIFAIIAITLALVFYTIGVFGERREKRLLKWHVVIFWMGLVCDTSGTTLMSVISRTGGGGMSSTELAIHGVTGALAIVLMLFHAIWATWTLRKGNAHQQEAFHKFSLFVWLIWLIPYFIGMFMGMGI